MAMQLTFRRYELTLIHNWTIATSQQAGGRTVAPIVLLELRDDDGVIGYGEAAPSLRYGEDAETAVKFLRKIDMSHMSFDDVNPGRAYVESLAPNNYSPKSAIGIALADGAAKKAKKSLHDFLGLTFVEGKHISSVSIGIDEPAEIRTKTQELAAFPILKLKVGSPNDRKNLAALREVAPEKTVRVDANEAWSTKEEALRQIEELAQDRHLELVEQPMPAANSPNDFAWLKARSPLPIVADESYMNANDAVRCAECFHGVNVKLTKTGGVIRAMEALHAARRMGLKTMIGCVVQSSLRSSAAAHLASLADWLDIDGNLLVSNDPFRGVTTRNGILSFANAPESFGLQVAPR
jgi:L-alanine-DL-glutamate epimerase-like enolase superfamily enzyme